MNQNNSFPRVKWIIRIAGTLTALIGGGFLLIWLVGVGNELSVQGIIIPKTNLSLALLLSGSSLLLLEQESIGRLRRLAATIFSAVAMIIGALTLSEHLFGWHMGIDQLLAVEVAGVSRTLSSNRMGPPASLSMTLIGLGLIALDLKRRKLVPYLGLAVCLITLVPAIGFLYGIRTFYSYPQLTGIAWPSVVALFSMGVGLVLAERKTGPMVMLLRVDTGGELLRKMLPLVILVPIALGFIRIQGQFYGLYDIATGTGMLTMALILLFSLFLWWSAAHLSRSATAEAEAHRVAKHLASFPQLNPNPVIELDPYGRVIFFNHGTQRVLETLGMDKGKVNVFLPADLDNILVDLGKKDESSFYREVTVKDRTFSETVYLTPQFNVVRIYVYDITERKRAEEKLEKMHAELERLVVERTAKLALQSRKMEAFLKHSLSPLVFLDKDFNFIRVNDAYAKACARDASDFVGHNHFVDYPSEELKGKLERVVRTKESYSVFGRPFVFPDHPEWGTTYWDLFVYPILDQKGEVDFLVFSLNDVTEHKIAQIALKQLNDTLEQRVAERTSELQQNKELLQLFIENAPAALAMFDREMHYLSVSRRWLIDYGLGERNLLGLSHYEVFPEIPERWREVHRRGLGGEIVRQDNDRFERVDGSVQWLRWEVRPWRTGAGEVGGVIVFTEDITERKRAEEELHRLNKALKALSDSSQATIRAEDEQRYLEEVCRIIIEDCGYTMVWIGFAENDEAKSVRPVAHAGFEEDYLETLELTWDDTERGRGPTGTAIRTGKVAVCRNMLTDPAFAPWREQARQRGYASSIVFPLHSEDKVFGAITIYSKEDDPFSEAEVKLLTELADDLSYGIEVLRTRSARMKAEEELHKLTEELKRSNADLQQFAYAASHDLQEPLRGIAGFARLLEKRYKGKLDEKADEFMDYIIGDSKRMQELIRDLLEYSRIETKPKAMKPTNCSVVLEEAFYNLRSAIEETGTELTYDYLPTVMADASQLKSLFQNLIGNAIKFHAKEKPRIHISAEQMGDEWVFSVKDNGIGFESELAERIFVVFQRLHTRGEYPGTGIGLAICKKIVERHGGRIWAKSEPGNGSTFYFTLPIRNELGSTFEHERQYALSSGSCIYFRPAIYPRGCVY